MSVRMSGGDRGRPWLAARSNETGAQLGMWVNSASGVVAEICAGSGVDMLVIDAEHGPNSVESVLVQLQAVQGYDVVPAVRVPANDDVVIKRYLDIGARNLIVPMVDSPHDAAEAAAAVAYPPGGVRGVGAALARASGWGADASYLSTARDGISLCVQIESVAAVEAVDEILGVPGVDGILVGPSDLAASMGLLGQQTHPEVVATVEACLVRAQAAGKPAGVNAFDPSLARRYGVAGARFVIVGADVTLLANGAKRLAATDLGAARGASDAPDAPSS